MSYTLTQVSRIRRNIINGQLPDIRKCVFASNVNSPIDENGNTPLHIAIVTKKISIIRFLLELGADGKLKNDLGETCEDLACRYFVPEYFNFFSEKISSTLNDTLILNDQINQKLTTSNEQVKTLKRKYTELNDKYNDVSASNIILRSQKETLIQQCDTLKAQNEFYKSSNDSRKKQK